MVYRKFIKYIENSIIIFKFHDWFNSYDHVKWGTENGVFLQVITRYPSVFSAKINLRQNTKLYFGNFKKMDLAKVGFSPGKFFYLLGYPSSFLL